MSTLRKQFDPNADYVVIRKMIVSSTWLVPDRTKLFDKGLVSGRLLRQLYEQFYLEIADPEMIKNASVTRTRRRRFSDGGAS